MKKLVSSCWSSLVSLPLSQLLLRSRLPTNRLPSISSLCCRLLSGFLPHPSTTRTSHRPSFFFAHARSLSFFGPSDKPVKRTTVASSPVIFLDLRPTSACAPMFRSSVRRPQCCRLQKITEMGFGLFFCVSRPSPHETCLFFACLFFSLGTHTQWRLSSHRCRPPFIWVKVLFLCTKVPVSWSRSFLHQVPDPSPHVCYFFRAKSHIGYCRGRRPSPSRLYQLRIPLFPRPLVPFFLLLVNGLLGSPDVNNLAVSPPPFWKWSPPQNQLTSFPFFRTFSQRPINKNSCPNSYKHIKRVLFPFPQPSTGNMRRSVPPIFPLFFSRDVSLCEDEVVGPSSLRCL